MGVIAAPAQAQTGFPEAPVKTSKPAHEMWDYNKEVKRFIVKFNALAGQTEESNLELLNQIAQGYGSTAEKVRDGQDGAWIIQLEPAVPKESALKFRAELESKAQINWADPDYLLVPLARPNDPLYQWQWQYANNGYNGMPEKSINAEKAWDLGYKGDGIDIAVVDTGITNHPDLNDKVKGGFDMIHDDHVAKDGQSGQYGQRDNDPSDPGDYAPYDGYCAPGAPATPSTWHGTHVAGLAAASTDNGIGVAGAAPEADIVPVRVLGACGGYESDIADGMLWAAGGYVPNTPVNENPARVVNLSLGGPGRCSSYYQDAVTKARRQGAVLLTAAGNDNVDVTNIQPANCNGVFLIGASGPMGEKAAYSNWGWQVDLAAPGGNSMYHQDRAAGILSTFNMGTRGPGAADYGYIDGTSMATPLVSGVVAMMLDANPDLTVARVEQILKNTAQDFGQRPPIGNSIGVGIVDAYEAVCQAIRDRGGNDCDDPQSEAPAPATTETVTPTTTTTKVPAAVTSVKTTATTPPTRVNTATVTRTVDVTTTTTKTLSNVVTKTVGVTETAAPSTRVATKIVTAPTATVTKTAGATVTARAPRVTETKTVTSTPAPYTVTMDPRTQTVETTAPRGTKTAVSTSRALTTLKPETKTQTPNPVTQTRNVTVTAQRPVTTLPVATDTVRPNPVTTTNRNTAVKTVTNAPATVTKTVENRVTATATKRVTKTVERTTTRRVSAPVVTSTSTKVLAPFTTTVTVAPTTTLKSVPVTKTVTLAPVTTTVTQRVHNVVVKPTVTATATDTPVTETVAVTSTAAAKADSEHDAASDSSDGSSSASSTSRWAVWGSLIAVGVIGLVAALVPAIASHPDVQRALGR